jgi:predicted small metal-binding protein
MKEITCECGKVFRGKTEEEALAQFERHMSEAHPDVVEHVVQDDLRAWMNED